MTQRLQTRVPDERSCLVLSPVQLDDFEAYLKDMSKDSAYKFSLQFEVRIFKPETCFINCTYLWIQADSRGDSYVMTHV